MRHRFANILIPTVVFAAALLPCAGCHENRMQTHANPADGEELPILNQIQGAHSHETRAMRLIVRDPQTLAQIPLNDVPVNFAEEMLLIVTLGQMTTDECSVHIDRVWREGGRLRVAVDVQSPETQSRVAMSSPYCIAVVPKCDLNVTDFTTTVPNRVRSWQQSPPPDQLITPPKPTKPPQLNREKKK